MNGTSDDELPELPRAAHSRSRRKIGFGEKSRAIATMLSWPSVLVLHKRTRPKPSIAIDDCSVGGYNKAYGTKEKLRFRAIDHLAA